MWVLVLIAIGPSFAADPSQSRVINATAMQSIPAFRSLAACDKAGKDVYAKHTTQPVIIYECVEVK